MDLEYELRREREFRVQNIKSFNVVIKESFMDLRPGKSGQSSDCVGLGPRKGKS